MGKLFRFIKKYQKKMLVIFILAGSLAVAFSSGYLWAKESPKKISFKVDLLSRHDVYEIFYQGECELEKGQKKYISEWIPYPGPPYPGANEWLIILARLETDETLIPYETEVQTINGRLILTRENADSKARYGWIFVRFKNGDRIY